MSNVEDAELQVAVAERAAEEAHVVYLQSLAEQWRSLASSKVRDLLVEKQPEITESLGDQMTELRRTVQEVIDVGADRVPDLFTARSAPATLVSKKGESVSRPRFDGFEGPTDQLAQPLHDVLTGWGYHPDYIKSGAAKASYSSSGFTESDFPLPSIEVTQTYLEVLGELASARAALAVAKHNAASSTAAALWDSE